MTRSGQSGQSATRPLGAVFAETTGARGHQPLLTYYDDGSGERTELSYATFFNWASKSANLLVEELDLGRDQTVAVGVTDHWTGAVLTVAAWMVGAAVVFATDEAGTADVVVVSEADATDHAGRPGLLVVGAGMGGRLTADGPGVAFGDEVLAFGDDYSDPDVSVDDLALAGPEPSSHRGVITHAEGVLAADDRLLVTAPLAPDSVTPLLVAPALAGASVVWCPAAGGTDLAGRIAAERVTHVLRSDGAVERVG